MPLPARSELPVDVGAVLQRLESAGRLQLTIAERGITHECFGSEMRWQEVDGRFLRRDGVGSTRFDPTFVTRIVADRTMKMGDRVLPRVEFRAADGSRMLAAYALDGVEPFDTALAGLDGAAAAASEDAPRPQPGELAPDDPGHVLLERVAASGLAVTIVMERPGVRQEWRGAFSMLHAMRGFDNVILEDFHLHLRAGTVAAWRQVEEATTVTHHALAADGAPLGLSISEKG